MTDVDLNDLKIDHDGRSSRKGMSILAVLVIFLLGGGVGFGIREFAPFLQNEGKQNREPEPVTSKTPVKKTPVPGAPKSFTEGGWIEVPSYHPIVVSSLIPGRLEKLNVLESSRVKKGDVIAVLYQKDLEETLKRAEAEVAAAAAELDRLEAGFRVQEVEKARADLKAAETDVELKQRVFLRTKGLLDSGAASAEDLERHQAALGNAEALRDARRQELLLKEEGSRKEDVLAAKAEHRRRVALRDLARNQLSYAVIKSPISGVVLERFVTEGTYIPVNNPRIVSLFDPQDLQVRVDVRQENIVRVFIGQKVEVFTDVEQGRAYAGKVIRIDPLADFKKNTVQVKVKLEAPSNHLYPEMIARIRFLLGDADGKPDRDG